MAWLRMAIMTLDLTKKTPHVSATLSTDVFSLDPYLPAQESQHSKRRQGRHWLGHITRSHFDRLNGVDGNLTLSAFQVKWNGAEIGPAELSGTLKDGKTGNRDSGRYPLWRQGNGENYA